ncbi:MAG: leucine-rich repeat protein [Clostridia bacterium]|nr:leucine-rich repeat protein [Clostridia bacterium]
MKKLIAVILVLTTLFSFLVIPTNAEGTADTVTPALENNISVDSTNSFGGLLSQTINSEMEKQLENNGFNVFSVEYSDGEALVELEALQDCTLFVGIYSEDGTKLITSQNLDITRDDTLVTLTFDISVVPTYFIIQAYLINTDDLKPLCSVYNSNMYTQEMQEFLSKTTDDFEQDKVLQFDDDKTNNFAVFNNTVELIDNNAQMTVTADEENGVYTITNPTDEVKALQVGDIFSYNYENGEVLIVKIASISADENGTITYTESELELEDVFDYVKIDSTASTEDSTIDTSNLGDGIVYNGLVEKPTTYAIDLEGSKGYSHSYDFIDHDFVEKDNIKVTLNGSVEFSLELKLKVYISLKEAYVEFQIEYQLEVGVELSGKISKTFVDLGGLHIVIVPGVIFVARPSVVLEATGKIGLYGRMKGSIGFKVSTKEGVTNISKTPKFEAEFKIEATVFLGISLKPALEIIDEKIAEASLEGVAGVEVKGALSKKATTDDEHHTCSACIEGEFNAKVSLGYKISLLNKEKWTYERDIFEIKLKITDFYFSFEYLEFDFTKCPHKEYRLTVNVKDSGGKNLKNIAVNIGNKSDTTNTFGNVSVFLPDGNYTVSIVNDKYVPISKSVTINGAPQKITRNLYPINNSSGGDSSSGVVSIGANKLSFGSYHSAVITEDGNLYIWGYNNDRQLGNGSTTNSKKPIKIMDNVATVSLGIDYSAAITKDGTLWTWGWNINGQLGNGTTAVSFTPQKIMDNVVTVSLGGYHSAAITKDGNLYTWGSNEYGQLGNGSTTNSEKPIKIMNNVAAVSLGWEHSAAITKDGSLYTWGYNYIGQLGNGTTTDSYKPIKIMDNVASVSLGAYHSAAIKKDGTLWTWGWNINGQLGNDSTTNSKKPIKIMNNVAAVSLGGEHSAAITKDGSLYTWGYNYIGQLGNGTTTDSYKPIKIMDNVVTVSLGGFHSAAITKHGSLYTWGYNDSGQLGNGTTTKSSIPIKINLPKIATYSLRNTTVNPNEFSGLIPNFIYNYYVMESDAVTNPLNNQNLKFIGQAISDEYGNLKLPEYTADIASTEPTIVLKEFTRVSGELEYLISSECTAIITGCTAENAVSIPDSLGDYIPTAIADMAFEGCYNLTDVTLANSITEIADGTFYAQENLIIHSNCKNDNTYFEAFANEQEIDFSIIHNFGEISLNKIPTEGKDGSVMHICADCNHNETLLLPYLKFKPALEIVDGTLLIKFKLPDSVFIGSGYENIGITLNGEAVEPNQENKYFYIYSTVDYNNYNSKLSADIIAEVGGQSFEANCSESISSIADVNSDTKFNIVDLVRIKKNIVSMKECDINGDDSTNSADLVLLRKLLLLKQN